MEWAFEVFQSQFVIVRGLGRAWHTNTIKHIIYACIISHNTIVENKRHTYDGNLNYNHVDDATSTIEVSKIILAYQRCINSLKEKKKKKRGGRTSRRGAMSISLIFFLIKQCPYQLNCQLANMLIHWQLKKGDILKLSLYNVLNWICNESNKTGSGIRFLLLYV